MKEYDIVIIGAGIYGVYASLNEEFMDKKVLIIEKESSIMTKASFVNQARIHNGYHYPRSIQTARTSAKYFNRFYQEYKFAINKEFKSIYAISKENSYTSKEKFEEFCNETKIPYKEIDYSIYFKENQVSGAYETVEYVYDCELIRKDFQDKISQRTNIDILYNSYIEKAEINGTRYILKLNNNERINTGCVINTSYASINQINGLFNIPKYKIKYELCEVELGKANENLRNVAITVMDGPFFSVMPFGKTGFHSLTSVCHTPHDTCYDSLPKFDCQRKSKICDMFSLNNCNNCEYRPDSKRDNMMKLYNKFLKDEFKFTYEKSLFAIKPILISSEEDDSRPTLITKHRDYPKFISCLSGKFNTMYLLDEYISLNFGMEDIKNAANN